MEAKARGRIVMNWLMIGFIAVAFLSTGWVLKDGYNLYMKRFVKVDTALTLKADEELFAHVLRDLGYTVTPPEPARIKTHMEIH